MLPPRRAHRIIDTNQDQAERVKAVVSDAIDVCCIAANCVAHVCVARHLPEVPVDIRDIPCLTALDVAQFMQFHILKDSVMLETFQDKIVAEWEDSDTSVRFEFAMENIKRYQGEETI